MPQLDTAALRVLSTICECVKTDFDSLKVETSMSKDAFIRKYVHMYVCSFT